MRDCTARCKQTSSQSTGQEYILIPRVAVAKTFKSTAVWTTVWCSTFNTRQCDTKHPSFCSACMRVQFHSGCRPFLRGAATPNAAPVTVDGCYPTTPTLKHHILSMFLSHCSCSSSISLCHRMCSIVVVQVVRQHTGQSQFPKTAFHVAAPARFRHHRSTLRPTPPPTASSVTR